MKKVLLLLALVSCFVACKKNSSSVNMNDGYVDLGLNTGTLWKVDNETGFYDLQQAIETFGNEQLPNAFDWFELVACCTVEKKENGCELTSNVNGKTIFFPYLSDDGGQNAGTLNTGSYLTSAIDGENVEIVTFALKNGMSADWMALATTAAVRCVRKPAQKDGYVDLGLQSGTLWKATNEDGGFYSFEQASKKFGTSNLPHLYMYQELQQECTWTWIGNGYHVQGPNASSIFLPAAGFRDLDGNVHNDIGAYMAADVDGQVVPSFFFSEEDGCYVIPSSVDAATSVRLAKIEERYVDLGLTSGAKWKNVNERVNGADKYYTYQEAVSNFRDLPDAPFFNELVNECSWEYSTAYYKVVKVIGPNKNYIFLPLAGEYSNGEYQDNSTATYWSATPSDDGWADFLYFSQMNGAHVGEREYASVKLPVRLVDKYVDLGLPSGTRWKRFNELGYYTHEEAVNKFTAANLPTKEQIAELENKCTWTWEDNKKSFIGKGPNGNKIIMPAAGYIRCDDVYRDQEERGLYWSSTLDDDKAYYLYLQTPSQPFVNVETEDPCFSFSVRLVK